MLSFDGNEEFIEFEELFFLCAMLSLGSWVAANNLVVLSLLIQNPYEGIFQRLRRSVRFVVAAY